MKSSKQRKGYKQVNISDQTYKAISDLAISDPDQTYYIAISDLNVNCHTLYKFSFCKQ